MPENPMHTIPTAALIQALRQFRELFEPGGKDEKGKPQLLAIRVSFALMLYDICSLLKELGVEDAALDVLGPELVGEIENLIGTVE